MKAFATLVFLAAASPAFAAPAFAAPALAVAAAAPVEAPHYVCERGPLSRVSLKTEAAACCVGQFGCPQLLSNTGLVKPRRDNRT